MKRMFKDEAMQRQFDEKGYVVVPLLNAEQVKDMYDFYLKENKRLENYDATYAEFSVLNAENENRRKLFKKITETFLPVANTFMEDCKPVIANYVCKEPGKGFVPVHQNWAVVDETKYASVSIWCPLVDVTEENGALAFVDGSHKHFRGPRGSYANRSFKDIDDHIVNTQLTYVPVKAGTAIILDDSIIHYSPPNTSANIRLAVQLIVVPQEADIYHYTFKEEGDAIKAELYAVDADYYLGMTNWKGDLSSYKLLDSFNFEHKLFTLEEYNERMNGKPQKGILRRVYDLITG